VKRPPGKRWLCLFAVALAAPASAYDLIGPDNCKLCHPQAYAAWKKSEHANAAVSLTGSFAKDGRCLTCHAPELSRGYGGVQCETCHGGGQFYTPNYVMKDAELARAVGLVDPTPALCAKCHDAAAPSLKSFLFEEKIKLVDHWTAEREARKASVAKPATPKTTRPKP
jgi:cytochrome c554/c'-like protein